MDLRPLKIYTKENSPRLRYIAGYILTDILGIPIEITTDRRKLGKHHVINYSGEKINGSFKINPDSLLFEKGISAREVKIDQWRGLPVFFSTSDDSDIPFDIFAAAFYLISRYEEYTGYQPDEYGRFPASSSLAAKNGFLQIPIVDRWIKEMAKVMLRKFDSIAFRRNEYKAMLTIDADQPFVNTGNGIVRSISSLFRDGQKTFPERDPYNVFDYIIETSGCNTSLKFFFPVGDHSKYDLNPSWKSGEYRKLITNIANIFDTGLHPSFYGGETLSMINKEVSRLNTILKKNICSCRFHYSKIKMPQSYRYLAEAGITEDYSMGYPDEPGFRAGIARPYYFYDVTEDRQSNLKVTPFQIMDGMLEKFKEDLPGSRALILNMIGETRKVGGLFVSIWHNTSLLENDSCKCLRDTFEFTLKNQLP